MQFKGLYIFVLAGLTLLILAAAGNGLFDRPLNYSDWQYRLFRGICHQIPERSLALNNVPMAVNARCFGIFSGLWMGWFLIPLVVLTTPRGVSMLHRKRWPGVILLVVLALHIIDFAAGHLSVWNSSNFSRFFLGIFLGIATTGLIADQFQNPAQPAQPASSA